MKPRIVCHRGLQEGIHQENTTSACVEALKNGFGVEVDIRLQGNKLIMSHDHGFFHHPEKDLDAFLQLAKEFNETIFLDVKESCMGQVLQDVIFNESNPEIYLFNQSVPDLISHTKLGLKIFARSSEFEEVNEKLSMLTAGTCIDLFEDTSLIVDYIQKNINRKLMIISPELHGRSHQAFWKVLKDIEVKETVYLCTDLPFEAREFFSSK